MRIQKLISGGQTGADRGGLDAALALGIPHGGGCPKGRRAEDGKIPDKYKLVETAGRDYSRRTQDNVRDADATLVFTYGPVTAGSQLTRSYAMYEEKPFLHVVLNVAGNRESKAPGIQQKVKEILVEVLRHDV